MSDWRCECTFSTDLNEDSRLSFIVKNHVDITIPSLSLSAPDFTKDVVSSLHHRGKLHFFSEILQVIQSSERDDGRWLLQSDGDGFFVMNRCLSLVYSNESYSTFYWTMFVQESVHSIVSFSCYGLTETFFILRWTAWRSCIIYEFPW